jgi:hypothetical protein
MRSALRSQEIKIPDKVRTWRNGKDSRLSVDKTEVMHMNEGTLRW